MRWLLRALLLALGLVFVASLLFVAATLFALWSARALWARLTGRPVAPWVFQVNPRARWTQFRDRTTRPRRGPTATRPAHSGNAALDDITDVVPRDPR
jgi:hypothetical protein